MAHYYFIGPNGQSQAPVAPEQLLMYGVKEDTLVWCEGMASWAKAGDIPELQPLFNKTPYTNTGKKVTVYGYTEAFAVNPSVKVLVKGVEIAEVARNESREIIIDGPCTMEFRCSLRTARCFVNPGEAVVLSFNRTTGSLGATVTTNEQVSNVIGNKKSSDSTRLILTIVGVILLLALVAAA